MMSDEPAKVLTIAGSDSGGAAGLQADLKTWTSLGVYGMSVVTAVTAQDSMKVHEVQFMSPELVRAQLRAVLDDYGAQAIKTGFLGQTALIMAVAQELKPFHSLRLVVDPVLVNHKKHFMFGTEVLQAYRDYLLPLANLITPNWHEALLLSGQSLEQAQSKGAVEETVLALHALGAENILITSILSGDEINDCWFDGEEIHLLRGPVIATKNVHGSGDTLSAAICAFLAKGYAMGAAIMEAREYTAKALQTAMSWQMGKGHGPLSHLNC